MLQIGFSNKYYTLWDVVNETEYSGSEGQYSYSVTRFTYIQNLSLVEENAIAKAKEMGCTDLCVNDELRGRSGRSWEKRTRIEEVFANNQFTFGKYQGNDIAKNTDVSYLKWYFSETNNTLAAERVCELDDNYSLYEGELLSSDILERILKAKKIEDTLAKTGTIELQMQRNLDEYGMVQIDGVNYYFEEHSLMSYNGYEYGLPILGCKAKRVKNKLIEVNVELGSVNGWDVWKVTSWDFVK